MKRTGLSILLAFILMACKKQGNPYDGIPVTNITSECLLKNTDIFMKYPYKIRVTDSIMFIWDLHGGDKFYHIYSYPNLEFITSFGEPGRGDKEFISTGGFEIDENYIYVFDTPRARLHIFSIDSLMHHHTRPYKIINFPTECIPVLSFAKMENGYALVNSNGEERITLVDTCGQIICKKYKLPITDSVEFNNYRMFAATLWDSFIDYNYPNKTLGVVTKLGDVLEIYNLADDSSKIVIGPGGAPGMFIKEGNASVGKIEGFSDIQVKEKSIYALYSGMPSEEIHTLTEKKLKTPNGGNFIHQYDLQGKLQKVYQLDRYVDGFDLHEDKGILFTVSSDDENPINKYKIPLD